MSLVVLPVVMPRDDARPEGVGPDHPMRRLTKEVAFHPRTWTPARAGKVAALFDDLASTWGTRDVPQRHDSLRDALRRGGPFPSGRCLEVGSGTGAATTDLVEVFDRPVAVDLSWEMLARAPSSTPRLQADSSALPIATGSISVIVLVNMLLFPAEVDRVLAADGVLVWVSTLGDATPIYLSAAEVVDALPGDWDGVTSSAGWGDWLAARRSSSIAS